MKIAIPIDRIEPARGGLERYVADLAGALVRRNHEVHIPTISGSLQGVDARLHPIRVAPGPGMLGRFARASEEWIRERRIDVSIGVGRSLGDAILQVHGGLYRISRAALRKADPSPVRSALRRAADAVRPKDRLLRDLEREQILHPDSRVIVALSEYSRRGIIEAFPQAAEKIRVIPIGVDLGRFPPGERKRHRRDLRARFGIPQDRLVAAFVAHHFRLKGLAPALRALGRVGGSGRAPHLIVVGRGRPGSYKREAERLGLDVTFSGPIDRPEAIFLGSDVLVHPTFHDPCSLATLEAWAAGLPVVTTRRNGAAELAKGSPAVAVVDDPDDTEGIARGISEMIRRDAWERRSAAARRIAESRSLDRHMDEMEALLEEVSAEEAHEGAAHR